MTTAPDARQQHLWDWLKAPGEDDRKWEQERKLTLAGKQANRNARECELPHGSCCGRCEHWTGDPTSPAFGECRRWVVAQTKRIFMRTEEAQAIVNLEWDYMRTRRFFAGCSQYAANEEEEA